MLSNFLVCVWAVLPLFVLMLIGAAVKWKGLLTAGEVSRLNHMIFVVCYPCMMFENLYGADLAQAFDLGLILFGVGSVLTVCAVSIPIVMKIEPSQRSRGAMIQAIYRSNFIIMGLPMAINVYGRGNVAVTAVLIAVVVPLYNVLAVVILEVFRGGKPNVKTVVKGVVTNPIILGAIAGLFFVFTGIRLPAPIETVIGDLSVTATTMALVVLGASFSFRSLERCRRNLVICVTGRLIAVPGIFLTAAAAAGFRGVAFVSLVSMLAAPTAISSYTMAESMGSDGELAGNCVIFSSAFSCLTLFLWLFLFKNLGMF